MLDQLLTPSNIAIMTTVLKQFIVGSSFLGSFSSLSFLNNFNLNMKNKDQFKKLSFVLPILVGVGSVIAFFLYKYIKSQLVYLVLGGVFGLAMTLYGEYVLKLTPMIFNFDEDKKWLLYLSSMGVYSFIFYFILRPIALFII